MAETWADVYFSPLYGGYPGNANRKRLLARAGVTGQGGTDSH